MELSAKAMATAPTTTAHSRRRRHGDDGSDDGGGAPAPTGAPRAVDPAVTGGSAGRAGSGTVAGVYGRSRGPPGRAGPARWPSSDPATTQELRGNCWPTGGAPATRAAMGLGGAAPASTQDSSGVGGPPDAMGSTHPPQSVARASASAGPIDPWA